MSDEAVEPVDRAALVRHALRSLVAEHGFHGASMSAVARFAGVATGTAYSHYTSKDALILAAYREAKAELGGAVTRGFDSGAAPPERFRQIWLAIHRHLMRHPDHARFLLQVDHSPYRHDLHAAMMAADDPLVALVTAPDLAARLVPLPLEVLWELGFAPAVRLAANAEEIALNPEQLTEVADACWRAVSKPSASPTSCGPDDSKIAAPRESRRYRRTGSA
jgi:AcrR family transcriptional regulator